MLIPPPVNPNVDDIADRAKYAFAMGTQVLAAAQYRLAELAGTGQLNPDESISLQEKLVNIWEVLYGGTLCAVRDEDADDCTCDEDPDDCTYGEADNTYSDGREVRIKIRVEPEETSDCKWEYNRFLLGDGAVAEHPRGTMCYIVPVDPHEDHVTDPPPSTDFEALRKRLLEAPIDGADGGDTECTDEDHEEG